MPEPEIEPLFNSRPRVCAFCDAGAVVGIDGRWVCDLHVNAAIAALFTSCCEDCDDDHHAPMCRMWEP